MPWGKDGNHGPWGGRPGGGAPQPPQPPDLDDLFRKGQDRLRRMVEGNNGQDGKRGLMLLAAAIVLMWAASGIYLVKADEQGVVLRFGEYHRTTPPGIGYHLPYPIESVATPKVTTVNRIEVGFRSGMSGRGGKNDGTVPEESLMLTGDENIVDVHFEVQWKIAKAEDFLFNVRDPEHTIKDVAESAMREVVGRTAITRALAAEGEIGTDLASMEVAAKKVLQDTLDTYKAGVEVVSVNLMQMDPPAQVLESFRDVQSARLDMETARNQAEAYRNDILPRARGEAEKLVLDAEAYRQEVGARAGGEASRFAAIFAQYKQAKEVTRKRMYLEAMEDILPNMRKMVVDKAAGSGVVPYLPLSEMKPAAGKQEATP